MRVLVTGGAGYVGSILCEHLLDSGYHVTVIDNLMYRQRSLFQLCANPRFDFVFGDVRDQTTIRRLLKDADVIIPLAAIVGAPACDSDPLIAQSVNSESVRALNHLRSPAQLLIFPSTESVYGNKSGGVYCDEDAVPSPISLYAETKLEAEKELLSSPNTSVLRLATVFGMSPRIRLDLLVNYFVYAAVTDGFLVVFEKDLRRNSIHVRDVADCFIHCIKNSARMVGNVFNVGLQSANLSKEELAYKVKEYIPSCYVHFPVQANDQDKRDYVVSNERLRKFGFEAKLSLDDGIRELLKGFRMMGRSSFKNN